MRNTRYYASEIKLYIDSDAAYPVLPKARSRGIDHFDFSDKLENMTSIPKPKLSGPVLTKCATICTIMSSAAEAECGTLFHNSKVAIPVRTDP